jgi:hypothetical protein
MRSCCARAFFAPWKHRHDRHSPERHVIRGVGGRRLEKIARKGFGGLSAPKRAYILHFNAAIFQGHTEKILTPLKKFLPDMRKKIDYERFLGYTSTGFESGS